jgi:hypothetical protein
MAWAAPQAADPNYPDFVVWVENFMAAPASVMPAPVVLQYAFGQALNMTLDLLQNVPTQSFYLANPPGPTDAAVLAAPSVYASAVYNLGGDILTRTAPDNPNAAPPPANAATFWGDLRTKFGVGSFSAGFITSASDQGTSESVTVLKQLQDMALGDLQLTKTPWGQAYLGIVSYWGSVWGLTV